MSQLIGQRLLRNLGVVGRLGAQPVAIGEAEAAAQAQVGVGGDRAPAGDDLEVFDPAGGPEEAAAVLVVYADAGEVAAYDWSEVVWRNTRMAFDGRGASRMEIGPDLDWIPCTYESCEHVSGPFYHGTAAALEPGTLIGPGFESNYQKGRVSNNVYFTALPAPAAGLAAELAVALTGAAPPGHIYLVEPTGPFEDDPNVTNKRFPGNPTKSYRSIHPLRVIAEIEDWEPSDPELVEGMLEELEKLRKQGLDLIED